MPLYEYRCKKCGKFEWMHDVNTQLGECPTCGGWVKKLISAGHFVMDGIMQTKSPNHPDNIKKGAEERKKHTKAGTLKEWKKENLERQKVDGKISY